MAAIDRRMQGENFPVALPILPAAIRNRLVDVYRFARLVDTAGDEFEGDRAELLDAIAAEVDAMYGAAPRTQLFRRLGATVHDCAIPREPFDRLIEANRRDQIQRRYPTFDDLLGYCALSANPVGHIVLHLFGAATPRRIALSDHVCSALQVLEHVQDVGEDFRAGRVYLPQRDLASAGCEEADLAAARTADRLRRVLEVQVLRADELLRSALPLVRDLRGFARLSVSGYAGGGLATARALRRSGFEVLAAPVKASSSSILRCSAGLLWGAR